MKKINLTGALVFILVLLSMPLGHAAMILMEYFFQYTALNIAAFLLGAVGFALAVIGSKSTKDSTSTLLGFFGGLFVWTGWIEFGYIYFAHKLSVAPLIENGEVVTKPEYLLMMSSVGFWIVIMLFYIFRINSKCIMYTWIQRTTNIPAEILGKSTIKNKSFTTFMETIMLLWSCYLVLMFAYDNDILGDRHPITIAIAISCLLWSIWLFNNLLKIRTVGTAIRYALPTVIIFWTFVEVLGRINIMEEIWVDPLQYKFEIGCLIFSFIAILVRVIFIKKRSNDYL